MRLLRPQVLFIVLCVCSGYLVNSQEFKMSNPGDVHVLKGRQIFLQWNHNKNHSEDLACVWEYDGFDPPDTPDPFKSFGDGITSGGSRGHDWTFINRDQPCVGGIVKVLAEKGDEGRYKMTILGEKPSDYSNVYVHEAEDLNYEVEAGLSSFTSDLNMPPSILNEIKAEKMTPISVRISDKFPKNSNISIEKQSQNQTEFTQQCPLSRSCEMKLYLGVEKDVSTVISIQTGLSDPSDIRVVQPFEYDGTSWDPDVIALICVLVLLSLACVATVLFAKFKPRLTKKKKSNDRARTISEGQTSHLLGELGGPPGAAVATGENEASYGLALSYFYGYIEKMTSEMPKHVARLQKQGVVDIHHRLVILVSKCGRIALEDHGIIETKHQMSIKISRNESRTIKVFDVRRQDETGKMVLINQPRNLATSDKMLRDGLYDSEDEKVKDVTKFCKYLEALLMDKKKCRDHYVLVQVSDEQGADLVEQLLQALKD